MIPTQISTGVTVLLTFAGLNLSAFGQPIPRKAEKSQATFSYAGQVLDQQAKPISGVEIVATHRDLDGKSYGYIATAKTDGQGKFVINRATALSGASPESTSNELIRLAFRHANYLYAHLEDIQLLSQEQAQNLSVTLRSGRSIQGRVQDAKHRPVPNAFVEVTFGDQSQFHRGTKSDEKGAFEIHGLPSLEGELSVLTTEQSQPALSASRKLNANQIDVGNLTATEIKIPPMSIHELFGMKLVDVDDTIQKLFQLADNQGVLILDPGVDSERLKIGELQRGDQFWIVGTEAVKNVEDFKNKLQAAVKKAEGKPIVRVVYRLRRADFSGTNTQYLELGEKEIDDLSR